MLTGFVLALLFISAAGWLVQVSRLLKKLESEHPTTYAALGSPQLLKNNTPASNISVIRYVFRDSEDVPDDPQLGRLRSSAKIWFVMSLTSFCCAVVLILANPPQ